MPANQAQAEVALVVADALREVAEALQSAYNNGEQSASIHIGDLIETLLSIADRCDPPASKLDE